MAIKLTVDIFSGRPNPTVILDDHETAELARRTKKRKGAAAALQGLGPSYLGYRGMVVEQIGKGVHHDLPPRLRLTDGAMESDRGKWLVADPMVEDFILSADGPGGRLGLDQGLRSFLVDAIAVRQADFARWAAVRWPLTLACDCAPLYEPQ